MYDRGVDSYLLTLKLILYWFGPSKMIEKLEDLVFSHDDMVFWDVDLDNVTLFSNDISLNSINPINFNLDDDNFDVYFLETIMMLYLWQMNKKK